MVHINTVNHPMFCESHRQNDFTMLKPHTLQWFELACMCVQLSHEPTGLYECGVFLCLEGRGCTSLREQLRVEALPGNTKLRAYINSDSVHHRVRVRHGVGPTDKSFLQWWAEDELMLTCVQGFVLCLQWVVSADVRFFRGRVAVDDLEMECWGHPESRFPLLHSGGPPHYAYGKTILSREVRPLI